MFSPWLSSEAYLKCSGSCREEREESTKYKRRKKAEPIESLDHGAIHLGLFLPGLLALAEVPFFGSVCLVICKNKNHLSALIVTKMELKKECDNIILEELEAPAPLKQKQKLILATGLLSTLQPGSCRIEDFRFVSNGMSQVKVVSCTYLNLIEEEQFL